MTTELEKLIEANTWRDIKDAPRDGTPLLGMWANEYGKWVGHISYQEGDWYHDGLGDPFSELNSLTHFRPIPDDRLANASRVLVEGLRTIQEIAWAQSDGVFADTATEALAEAEKLAKGDGS